MLLCLLCLPSPAQEEIAFKAARLQRVAKATAAARLETSAMAAEFQAEREKLLGDIRQLSSLIKQKAGSCAACCAVLHAPAPGAGPVLLPAAAGLRWLWRGWA